MEDEYTVVNQVTGQEQIFTDQKEAGAAFFHVERTDRPMVHHVIDGRKGRTMAHTMIQGTYVNGEIIFVKKLPSSHKGDKEFVDGYMEALEMSVNKRLNQADWEKAMPVHPNEAPNLDYHLYEDIDMLARTDSNKVINAWREYAPAWASFPRYEERPWKNSDLRDKQSTDLYDKIRRATNTRSMDNNAMSDNIKLMTIEQERSYRSSMLDGYPEHEAKSIALDGRSENNGIESEGSINKANNKLLDPKFYEKYQVRDTKRGKEFYWKDSDKIAFRERGEKKLITESNSKQVAESIVEVAQSRGWEIIKVTGNERFRQLVWMEANLKGMQVNGYKPSEQDRYELEQRLANVNTVERGEQNAQENRIEREQPSSTKQATVLRGRDMANETTEETRQKPTDQERNNYRLLKEVKEDENTSITRREMDGEMSVTVSVKEGNKNERMTFKVDEKTESARAAVLHVSEGDKVDRNVVTNRTADKALTKKIEAGLATVHSRQHQREQDTAIVERINGDRAPYRDRAETDAQIEALTQAYSTLNKEDAIKRHPELEDLYTLEGAATELANRRIGNQQSRDDYVKAIRDRSISELAQGHALPIINERAQSKQMEKQIER